MYRYYEIKNTNVIKLFLQYGVNRYIKNEFDLDYKVTIGKFTLIQVLNLLQKKLTLMRTIEFDSKFGTLQGKKVSEVLLKVSTETQLL